MHGGPWALWLPLRLPGLNELLNSRANIFGSSKGATCRRRRSQLANEYSKLKKATERDIGILARAMPPIGRGFWTYLFVEPNRRRDPSNVASGAVKLIEDALQKEGKLENDGWGHVLGIQLYWEVGPRYGVLVAVSEADVLERSEAIALWREAAAGGER